jgi:hypothetical protein
MEEALRNDTEFLALLKDEIFACAAYQSFCNEVYINDDRQRFSCSWRYAGGLIAELRNEGEDYIDYYMDFVKGELFDQTDPYKNTIQQIYNRLGWRLLTVDDQVQDFKVASVLLTEKLNLPKTSTPDWYGVFKEHIKDWDARFADNGIVSVVHRATNDGQISKDDYSYFLDVLIVDAEASDILEKEGLIKR